GRLRPRRPCARPLPVPLEPARVSACRRGGADRAGRAARGRRALRRSPAVGARRPAGARPTGGALARAGPGAGPGPGCRRLLLRLRRRLVVLPEAELVSLRVGASREPAHLRDRHRLARLAPELAHARGAGGDVVDVEVGARPALSELHVRDRDALLLADLGHVVLGRPREGLELPPEERAPEPLALTRVVRGNLRVHDLARHLSPLVVRGCAWRYDSLGGR